MDFLDSVVKSSNAIIKDRLNNPFGSKSAHQSSGAESAADQPGEAVSEAPSTSALDGQLPPEPTATGPQNAGSSPEMTGQPADKFAAIAADAEAVRKNAVKGAKNIGSFLFSMANKASQTVSQTAKQVKQVVESTSILTDFTREQQEFIKEHGGSMQSGQLPWLDDDVVGDQTKASEIREQILGLSQDKRNFVRSPPKGANFEFDSQKCYPIALSLLKEDPNLGKMRFELVPKLVAEDTFWCNYFYRLSLLKHEIATGQTSNQSKTQAGWSSSRSSSGEGPDDTNLEDTNSGEDTTYPTTALISTTKYRSASTLDRQQQENQFDVIGDTSIDADNFSVDDNDLKNKLKELNIAPLDEGQDA